MTLVLLAFAAAAMGMTYGRWQMLLLPVVVAGAYLGAGLLGMADLQDSPVLLGLAVAEFGLAVGVVIRRRFLSKRV